jgi:hypothetical protein
MPTTTVASQRIQAGIATLILTLGLLLLSYMIVVEGEPGAVPLLLVLAGGVWLYVVRRRSRSSADAEEHRGVG